MEVSRMFFDVGCERDEVLVDERGGLVVVVRFGFQPSASASSGSSAEVDQQWLLACFSFGERGVGVFDPVYFHDVPP